MRLYKNLATVLGAALFVLAPFTVFADTTYTVDSGVFFASNGNAQFNDRSTGVDNFTHAVQVGDTVIIGNACNTGTFTVVDTGNALDQFPSVNFSLSGWSSCYNGGGGVTFTIHTAPPPAPPSCGLGCAGTPTLYTAGFGSTTAQAAAIGALSDLSSFAAGYIPHIIVLIIALIALGTGLYYVKRQISGHTWDGPSNGLGDGLSRAELGDSWGIVDNETKQLAASGKRDTYL